VLLTFVYQVAFYTNKTVHIFKIELQDKLSGRHVTWLCMRTLNSAFMTEWTCRPTAE